MSLEALLGSGGGWNPLQGAQDLFTGSQDRRTARQLARMDQRTTGVQDRLSQLMRGDETTRAALTSLLGELGSPVDSSAQMQAAIDQVMKSGAPVIGNLAAGSGGFNSSTTALAQGELASQAANAAAMMDMQMQEQRVAQLLDAIGLGQAGTAVETGRTAMDEFIDADASNKATGNRPTADSALGAIMGGGAAGASIAGLPQVLTTPPAATGGGTDGGTGGQITPTQPPANRRQLDTTPDYGITPVEGEEELMQRLAQMLAPTV